MKLYFTNIKESVIPNIEFGHVLDVINYLNDSLDLDDFFNRINYIESVDDFWNINYDVHADGQSVTAIIETTDNDDFYEKVDINF